MKTLKPVLPNKGVEKDYKKKLDKLVDSMSASVMYWILADYENRTPVQMATAIQKRIKQWKKIFGDKADEMALWFVKKIKNHTVVGMNNAFKAADLKMRKGLSAEVQKAVEIENSALIESVPEKYFTGVETVAMLALLYGWTKEEFKERLEHRYEVCKRRIKTIASDQTYKTTELFKRDICQNEGIIYAKWQYTYRSEKPRESHQMMDGKLFDINVGCYDEDKGEYVFPGQLINCYHKDTEVMTENGFKKFTELSFNDKILTLNPQTKNLEYANIKAFYRKASDKILHIKGKSLDMAVDYNHRFFTYKTIEHGPHNYTLEPRFTVGFDNLSIKLNKFYGSSEWIGEDKKTFSVGEKTFNAKTFLKFMAYYLSEGHIDHKRKTNCIHITQFKYLDKIYDDLKEMGFHKNKGCLRLYDKDIVKMLKQFGYSYEKYIPDFIKNSSKELLRCFLDAYALGDGTLRKKKQMFGKDANTCQYYYTSSKRMADDLVECIIKAGGSASIKFEKRKGKVINFKNGSYETKTDIYIVTEKKKQFMQLKTAKVVIEPYNDWLYDIEVDKNNTLLVKYNSCVHWNGNCKCNFVPVIEELGDDIRKQIEINAYYKNVARGNNY